MEQKIAVTYVTSSTYKREEIKIIRENVRLPDGMLVDEVFTFDIRSVPIAERLEVDIDKMVQEEVVESYKKVRVPCIVEHAGIIFDDYGALSYPGGLTKAMWNALGERFLKETNSAGRRVVARAVVAYCDGKRVCTFVGERTGSRSVEPRGQREFYWDTVMIPDDPSGRGSGKMYAEIVAEPSLGLTYKVAALSQSTAAMIEFLTFRRNSFPELFRFS